MDKESRKRGKTEKILKKNLYWSATTDRFLYQKWCYDGVVGLERSQIFRATTFREMEFPFLA